MRYLSSLFLAFFALGAQAVPLTMTIEDPQGDHTGAIDLLAVQMSFDNATGDYDILWIADTAAPFMSPAPIRINANFRNITLDGTLPRSPTFSDTLNDFIVPAPGVAQLQISGNAAELLRWRAGDEIAYILPGAGGFSISGVRGDDWGPSDPSAPMRTAFVSGTVSEPTSLAVLLLGLPVLIAVARRRSKEPHPDRCPGRQGVQ